MEARYNSKLRDPRLASRDTLQRLDFSSAATSFSRLAVARSWGMRCRARVRDDVVQLGSVGVRWRWAFVTLGHDAAAF
jgi:hypothetical protein